MRQLAGLFVALMLLCVWSCRTDDEVVWPDVSVVTPPAEPAHARGLYVLCEGNMGSNKASLDYLDIATGVYQKNIFPSRNPGQVMQLGDVGNDAQIYGSQLWLVIDCSNKVEVCDAATARSRGHVDVPNCRYVAFHEGYAYVSSYVGRVGGGSVLGSVYKIDTLSLEVKGRCTVGYQPDELCVFEGKLYVANSGGYNPLTSESLGYDHTVSVIDLETFTEERKIEVAPNPFRIRPDNHGQLWVSTRGVDDYDNPVPARLYLLRKGADGVMAVADSIDRVVNDLDIVGDSLYFCGSHLEGRKMVRGYGVVSTKDCRVVSDTLLQNDGTWKIATPYGIKVNPETGYRYLMDATNYVSSGYLLCFDKQGKFLWRTATGDIPGHACFLMSNDI